MGSLSVKNCELTIPAVKQKINQAGDVTNERLLKDLEEFINSIRTHFKK
jgi:hypothetical protein